MSPRSRCLVVTGLLLASLSGCTVVGSVHPLSDARSSIKDDRLLGEWISLNPSTKEPASEEDRLVIRPAAKGEGYEAVNPNQADSARLYVAELGKQRFLSAEAKEDDGAVRFLLVKYEFQNDEIRMYLPDPERTAAAIGQGLIDGTVKREDPPDDDPNVEAKLKEVLLTASTADLRRFLESKPGQAIIHVDEPAVILKRAAK